MPEHVLWRAAGVDDACPSCIIFVSLSLEGFARFSVLSILSVVVRKFCQLGAAQLGSFMLSPDAADAPGESARRPEVFPLHACFGWISWESLGKVPENA